MSQSLTHVLDILVKYLAVRRDEALSQDQKDRIGREILKALPDPVLVPGANATRDVLLDLIKPKEAETHDDRKPAPGGRKGPAKASQKAS